jgi:tetratricopeptide (TPR) repeat protein
MQFAAGLLALLLLFQQPDYHAEGTKALEEQRYEEAAGIFAKAVEAEPKDYAAWFHLGLSQSLLKRNEEAIASYRKVLELKPGLYEAQLNLGMLLSGMEQYPEAADLLREAANQKPKEPRPALYLGDIFLATGQHQRAELEFAKALELDPKLIDAELGLARALVKQKRLDEAETHFAKAGALLELAPFYEAENRFDKAIAIYEKYPDDPAARERTGELLLESGRAEDAIPHLTFAVEKSPTSANRYALAIAFNATKQYAKAEPLLAQAVQGEPGNADLRMTYARNLREQKKYAPAAQEFYRVAQAQPESAEAWSDLAGMLILLEQYPEAVVALDKVKALGAEKAAHHYFRAIVLDKHHMYEPALASYEKFLEMSGGKNPDEEFKARQRIRVIKKELSKR